MRRTKKDPARQGPSPGTKKDRIKAVRAVLEAICLLLLLLLILRALFSFKRYEPYDKSAVHAGAVDAGGIGADGGLKTPAALSPCPISASTGTGTRP